MTLKNRAYDALKFVALVLLPGVSAAYFGLAQIWGLPNAEEIVGTLTVIDTLLGLLIKTSATTHAKAVEAEANVTDGVLVVAQDDVDGEKYLTLHVDRETMDTLSSRNTVKLSVADKTVVQSPA